MDALSKDAELSVKVPKLIVNEGVRVARDEEQKVKEIKKNQLNTFDKKTQWVNFSSSGKDGTH